MKRTFLFLLSWSALLSSCSEKPAHLTSGNGEEPNFLKTLLLSDDPLAVVDSCRQFWIRNDSTVAGLQLRARDAVPVLINRDGAMLVNGELVALPDLGERLQGLYFNPGENPDYPGQELIDSHRVSQAVFLVDFQEETPADRRSHPCR